MGASWGSKLPLTPGMTSLAPLIHVVDDDASFRVALARLLKGSGYRAALYRSAHHLLEELPKKIDVGCILIDVRMPGLNGLDLQARLTEIDNTLPIVFLTGHGDIPMSVRAIKAGAEDFLLKPVSKKALLDAIQRALTRYENTRERSARLRSLRSLVETLTPRQSEVFALIVAGKLNKQIAHELGTSERTIKAHRQAVMQKLKARSLVEAVSIAEQLRDPAAPAAVKPS
jgi:RNA polymerase sigma factor (sigma-70 family)